MLAIEKGTLLPYFTAGWPSPEGFLEGVCGAARAGCKAFEVGIPFSDPVADGPVIQMTSSQALESGMNWQRSLELTTEAVRRSGIPAIAMTYCNLLYSAGLEQAMEQLARAGVAGLIVPDLTVEEGEPFEQAAAAAGLDLIYLVAPTTPEDRIRLLAQRSRGFLYMVSVRGVTGERQELPADLSAQIDKVVERCSIPVLVGFGVSTPGQARQISDRCHGAIVGSALLRKLVDKNPSDCGAICESYLGELLQGMLENR